MVAGCESITARAALFLGFCIVIGMGMRFSKTWFTEVHLFPGGRMAQSKMAAISLYGMQPFGDKIVRSWHEIGQIICNLGPGIQIYHFKKCHIDSFCVKSIQYGRQIQWKLLKKQVPYEIMCMVVMHCMKYILIALSTCKSIIDFQNLIHPGAPAPWWP